MTRPIRVLIADDHQVVLSTLCLMLRSAEDVEIVGLAADGDEAVELSATVDPDVIVMDYSMPRMSGAEATRRILEAGRRATVVGLSMYTPERGDEMRRAGAVICLDKADEIDDVVTAVRLAGSLPPSAMQRSIAS